MNSPTSIDHRTSAATSRIASGCPKPGTGPTGRARLFPAVLAALIALLIPVFSEAAWYDSNWAYRKAVTIDGSQVSGGPHTDFPVLISLTDTDLSAARADGFDLLFTLDDGSTQLSHEIENFDNTTGELAAWVKIPSPGLTNGADLTLYLYYGNAVASNQQNVLDVWSKNYILVYHLHDDFNDSRGTSNATNNGSVNVSPAQIADGQYTDGSTYINTNWGDGVGEDLTALTYSCWIKADALPDGIGDEGIVHKTQNGMMTWGHVDSYYEGAFSANIPGDGYLAASFNITALDVGRWVYLVGSYEVGSLRAYKDGNLETENNLGTVVPEANGDSIRIGKHSQDWRNNPEDYFPGEIDEVRISSVVRSADWILTEYRNQNSPGVGGFLLSTGSQETESGGNVYYVRTDGNDTNPGTINSAAGAWRTIQHAANTMVAGDKVYVVAGTYNGLIVPANSGSVGNPITYEAMGTVVLDGQDNGVDSPCYAFQIESKDYIVIDGFEFTNYRDCTNVQANVYFNDSDFGVIRNSVFHHTGRDGITFRGTSSNGLVFNNLLHNIDDEGITPAGAGSHTIRNNTIYNCGINTGGNGWAMEAADTAGNVYENNIFWHAIQTPTAGAYNYNDYINNATLPLPGTGNFQADPLFVDIATDDFHLQHIAAGQAADSPCIDTGSDTAANIGLDTRTTRTDAVGDSGTVDLGYHYPNGIPDTTAPAAITDLAASNPGSNSLDLTWTAPGDDDSSGIATTYDIRYSTGPITNDAEFAAATAVGSPPVPQAAGSSESFTVTGLNSGTTYYFAIKAADEVPNWSTLSIVPNASTTGCGPATLPFFDDFDRIDNTNVGNCWVETEDVSAYAEILSNRMVIASDNDVNLPIVERAFATVSSGWLRWRYVFHWGKNTSEGTYELFMQLGDSNTMVAPGTSTYPNANDSAGVAVNLKWAGTNRGMGSNPEFGYVQGTTVTPVQAIGPDGDGDHIIEVLADVDNQAFNLFIDGALVAANVAFADIGVSSIDTVRFYTDELATGNGFSSTEFDDVRIEQVGNTVYYVRTDGDDENAGLGNSAGEAWATIQRAANTMVPGDMVYVVAGTYNEALVPLNSGSSGNRIAYRAIGDVVLDGQDNPARCNAFRLDNKDYIIIDGFEIINYPTCAEQNDGTIRVANSEYVQILNNVIHHTGEDGINLVSSTTTAHTLVANNLIYKTDDDCVEANGAGSNIFRNNTFYWCNQVSASTGMAIDGSENGNLFEYNIIADGLNAISGTTFNYNLFTEDPSSYGGSGNFQDVPGFVDTATDDYHLNHIAAGQATDSPAIDAGDVTAASQGLDTRTTRTDAIADSGNVDIGYHYPTGIQDTTAPAAITDLATGAVTSSSVELTWTAPGDDDSSGTATTYDIRYSTSPIGNDTDFNNADQATGEPAPQIAGSSESFTVTGLSPGTTYYFAVKTVDEVPNWSGLSNTPVNASTNAPSCTVTASGTYIEAENYTQLLTGTPTFVVESEGTYGGFNGTGYLRATGSLTGTLPPAGGQQRADYPLYFDTPGDYHIWIRGYATGDGNNSIFVGLDNAYLGHLQITSGSWGSWYDTSTVQGGSRMFNIPAAGTYIFNLWPREGDFRVDGIFISTNSSATPSAANEIDPNNCINAVTSAVAEIAPNEVVAGSSGTAFTYDILATIGAGDSGVDRITITVPATFGDPTVTGVTVGGTPAAYTDNTAGKLISIELTTPVTSTGNIQVQFSADGPAAAGSAEFTSSVENSGTGVAAQPTTMGNADGDGGDADSWTVTTIGCVTYGLPFFDDFERAPGSFVGNCWTEDETGGDDAQITTGGKLLLDSNDTSISPRVTHTFTPQTNGYLRWTFDFDWSRISTLEDIYEIWMQLGNAAQMQNIATDQHQGVGVNIFWGRNGSSITTQETMAYQTSTEVKSLGVLSGAHTFEVIVNLDTYRYDIIIDGSTWANGVPFHNNVNIDAVRFYTSQMNTDTNRFSGRTFDDVRIEPIDCTTGRVSDGLQVLYDFAEGSGATVYDISGVGSPMNLTIRDPGNVSWIPGGGLSIDDIALIDSDGAATKIIDACQLSSELTLEAWITPANTTINGPGRIMTLSANPTNRNFTMGQYVDQYEIRMRTSGSDLNGLNRRIFSPAGTLTTDLTHVVYTRDSTGTGRVYINGVEVSSRSDPLEDFSNWNNGYWFALAHELDRSVGRNWLGDYHLAAVYSKALTHYEVCRNFTAGVPAATPPVTAALAEIAANDVAMFSLSNSFTYDIAVTIGGGDTGVDQVSVTVPNTFGDPIVTDVLVGGVSRSGAYSDNTSGKLIDIILDDRITTSDSIQILFTADGPIAEDTVGQDFTATVDDTATPAPDQAAVEGDANGDGGADGDDWTVTATLHPLSIVKKAFTSNGIPIPDSATVPRGMAFKFLIYINNPESARGDISLQDVLDAAFTYQAGTMKIDNTLGSCSAATCDAAEEAAIFAAAAAGAAVTDAADGDAASYNAGAVDVGNQVVGGNAAVDIVGGSVWALVFDVVMN